MTCIYQADLRLLLSGLPGARFSIPKPPEGPVMNISDSTTKIESCEKSPLITRIAGLNEAPILTLVDTASQPTEPEAPDMPDPLIQALVKKLPKPNSSWSIEDRAKWLRAAAIIFNLVYKPGEADAKTEDMPTDLKSAG
jgi:hypothetical protein